MKRGKKIIIIVAGIVLAIILAMVIFSAVQMRNMQKKADALENADIDMNRVKDGDYTAFTDMGLVKVEVEVSVKDHQITNVNILRHDNGKGKPAEVIVEEMVKENTDQVEAVSGATYSSEAIKNAVNKALQKGLE